MMTSLQGALALTTKGSKMAAVRPLLCTFSVLLSAKPISADPRQLQGECVREKVPLRPSSVAWNPPTPGNCRGARPRSRCSILGAFQEVFSWLQKAPLGSSLPSNAPRPEAFAAFWALSKRFSSGFRKQRYAVACLQRLCGALAGSFCSMPGTFPDVF